ncbi:MAG: lysylphosphatidylglycerol synthase transmembrane domain-containing protein [Pseudomonadota bacterium]
MESAQKTHAENNGAILEIAENTKIRSGSVVRAQNNHRSRATPDHHAMPRTMIAKPLIACAKLGLSAGLIIWFGQQFDWRLIQQNLGEMRPTSAISCLGCMLLITIVSGLRWHMVMSELRLPLSRKFALSSIFVGAFFSQVFPTSVGGDAVRVWHVWRKGTPKGSAFLSVLLERLSGVAALVVMVAIGTALLNKEIDDAPIWFFLMAVLPAFGIGVLFISRLDKHNRLAWFPWLKNVSSLSMPVRRILFSWPLAPRLFMLSIGGHFLACLALYSLAQGLDFPLSLLQCLGLLPSVILFSLIPISFAGWGIREGAMVIMMGFAGLTPAMALSLSILFGLALLAASLPGLCLWMLRCPRF